MLKSGGDDLIFVPPTSKTGGDMSPPSPPGLTPLATFPLISGLSVLVISCEIVISILGQKL